LRAYTNAAAKELSYYSTSRGWFPVLFSKLGFRVCEVAVSHHERPGGEQSKHSVFTRLDQFMSVFMGATTKPFQFVEVVGFSALGLAGLGVIAGLVARSWALALGGFAVGLWAFSLVITGMVGEYLVRMNYEVGRKPKYLVRKIHE
jgi:undecaprenyl-phosphate 4-deoxy-4-formamido-L-arabinose transferase